MLHSSRLCLRALQPEDINLTYLAWLNDPAVNRYLETRFLPQTLESLDTYWKVHRDDQLSPWFAICLQSNGLHIGNIKLGPIQWIHRRADLSLFIGNRNCWGQGHGIFQTETINSILIHFHSATRMKRCSMTTTEACALNK